MTDLTPMMQQYRSIKEQYRDAILFFRLGDFYEMFEEDAVLASRELEITLTGRGYENSRVPMCGIPYHAADGYLQRLLKRGHKVVICEQVENPRLAQGVVKREVVKILTPGTLLEPDSPKSNNYLATIAMGDEAAGLAYLDASTGEFRVTVLPEDKLLDEIIRIAPAECLMPDTFALDHPDWVRQLKAQSIFLSYYDAYLDQDLAEEVLRAQFRVASLESFGIAGEGPAILAAGAAVRYLADNQKTELLHLNRIRRYFSSEFMYLDPATRRNLEITKTMRDRDLKGSLLWVLDRTRTPMGGRLLRHWLQEPCLTLAPIEDRLAAVEELTRRLTLRQELGEILAKIYDIERLAGKVAAASANARDLSALKVSLMILPRLKAALADTTAAILKEVSRIPDLTPVVELIDRAIVDNPRLSLREGGMIKRGYSEELDELYQLSSGGKEWIARLEAGERQRTGIRSLKVGFTKVFGYYLEVTRANVLQVPADYIRKQTLVNAERFITPELKEKEALILNAEEKIGALEYEVFAEVRKRVADFTLHLQAVGAAVAVADVILSLAEVAVSGGYCRPEITASGEIEIEAGRHPVAEKTLGEYPFVPNPLHFDKEHNFLIVTGPNMAGKSTYLRQAAIITLLAQIGSFVPAERAKISPVDRIFTRIGAMDDLYSGQSTFMLEMTETANILNHATGNSLIILDEIGRGTSTFDGMAIAAAAAEYIYTKIGAKTLFATHYHELTQLAGKHSAMKNYNTAVKEEGDRVTFLYRIIPGPADKSYGIHVAGLAGLPPEVITRAKEVYATLEMVENDLSQKKKARRAISSEKPQLGLF